MSTDQLGPVLVDIAKRHVDNKALFKRIINSTSLSGGVKASKVAGLGANLGRKALSTFVPIPAIAATVVNKLASTVEGNIRKGLHNKRIQEAKISGDVKTEVKFQLKELSIANLDGYRRKITEALSDLDKARATFNRGGSDYVGQHRPCDQYMPMMLAIAQLDRRCRKLQEEIGKIAEVMALTRGWLTEGAETGQKMEYAFWDRFHDLMPDDQAAHANCDSALCCVKNQNAHLPTGARLAKAVVENSAVKTGRKWGGNAIFSAPMDYMLLGPTRGDDGGVKLSVSGYNASDKGYVKY